MAITDAKSLFDGANTEQAQGDGSRSALEIAIIQQSLAQCQGRLRWVPHNHNLADALTKTETAHREPLLNIMQNNSLQIELEESILTREKQSDHRRKVKN